MAEASPDPPGPSRRRLLLQRRLERQPHDAPAWRQLAELHEGLGQLEQALPCRQRFCELEPHDVQGHSQLGHLCRNLALPELAIHHHGQALALRPDSLTLALNHAFVLPVVAGDAACIDHHRQRCEALFASILRHPRWRWHPADISTCHPYYLAYHNRNDVALLRDYGGLLSRWIPPPPPVQAGEAVAAALPPPGRRPRLGLLSGFFYGHSHARAFEGLIAGLDRDQLETVLIHLASAPADATSERLGRACSRVVHLPAAGDQATATLAGLQLDVLFFTDLGMHPLMTWLAATRRHAPLQLAGWGWPLSSGLPRIDHYISSAAVEPADATDHYSETLVTLPGLPCSYPRALLSHEPLPRDYFLLPAGQLLVGCLQPAQKFHPDFDALLEAIVVGVPEALLVLVEDRTPTLTARLLERLERRSALLRSRVVVLQQMGRQEFLALASCLDLLLDPPYFGSGVSLFESIHAGTPLVTLEGAFLRSRLVAATYRLLQLPDAPVAADPASYARIACELLRDPERRLRLRRELAERVRAGLYDRQEGVRGFEAFLLEAVARQRASPRG